MKGPYQSVLYGGAQAPQGPPERAMVAVGEAWQDSGLVFDHGDGTVIDPSMTLDRSAHVSLDMQRDAADRLDEALGA